MKRFSFRLASILRVRRAEEARDLELLQQANHRLRDLILTRDDERSRYETVRAKVTDLTNATREAFFVEELVAHLAASTLANAERAVANAAADAAMAQVNWLMASRKVAVLERLEAQRFAEHLEEQRKTEAAVVDDLVTIRYVLSQQADSLESAS